MDLSKLSDVKELKSLAYDELVKKQQAEINLEAINKRLGEVLMQEAEAAKSEKASK